MTAALQTRASQALEEAPSERAETNTKILTFNQSHITKEVKIGYGLVRVKQYVPAVLKCFKYPKYGYQRETWSKQTCLKYSEKEKNTRRKIAWRKLDVQTADKTIHFTKDLVSLIKKKRTY